MAALLGCQRRNVTVGATESDYYLYFPYYRVVCVFLLYTQRRLSAKWNDKVAKFLFALLLLHCLLFGCQTGVMEKTEKNNKNAK